MAGIDVTVLSEIDGGIEVGSESCVCGDCRPTATIYRDDPTYERHSAKGAEGPCCCGRFFVVGQDARVAADRARAVASRPNRQKHSYRFEEDSVELPWGDTFAVVVGDLAT